MLDEDSVLRGTVEQVIFTNPDSGWTVLRLSVPDAARPVTVVGAVAPPTPGARLEITGRWQENPKYGRQFRAATAVPITPKTSEGIEAYLASGLVEGLGPSLAARLVEAFGADTLEIIEKTPERLTEVEGIGRVRAARIREALADQLHLRSSMVFLYGLGIPPYLAAKIQRRYGARTVHVVQTEPFRLALDVRGVGFGTADRIAARLGVDRRAPQRAQAGVMHALAEAAQEGHVFLPKAGLIDAASALLGTDADIDGALEVLADEGRTVVPDGTDAVYAAPMYGSETTVIRHLNRIAAAPAGPLVDDPEIVADDFERSAGLKLAPQQRRALVTANTARLMIVTGGPGTGKTTLVRGLLQLFQCASVAVQLGAPTGRAAKRLTESTGLEARTLHRLLAYDPHQHGFAHDESNPIAADAVVVDEMSMVDLPLMASLAAALPDRVRLIVVGDVDQLPSVGPGQVLKDLIDSARFPVVRLDRVFRQGHDSRIIDNAHRINSGQLPDLEPTKGRRTDFYLIDREEPQAAQDTLLHVVADRIPASFGVDPFDDVQVLTPMHKGELGASVLNRKLQAQLNPDGASVTRGETVFRVGDKVMQTRNDYGINVFNGDVGRLVHVDPDRRTFKVAFDGREVSYEPDQQDALALAYAISIHKSQGSEYPVVVIPLTTQHFVMLHRNLLYTAVTRGKRLVVLVGSRRALQLAVARARDLRRHSRLADRLSVGG